MSRVMTVEYNKVAYLTVNKKYLKVTKHVYFVMTFICWKGESMEGGSFFLGVSS